MVSPVIVTRGLVVGGVRQARDSVARNPSVRLLAIHHRGLRAMSKIRRLVWDRDRVGGERGVVFVYLWKVN